MSALIAAMPATIVGSSILGKIEESRMLQMPADTRQCSTPLSAGEYHDLTLMRQWKIATSFYVNPELLKRSAIAYGYDIDELVASAGDMDISEELNKYSNTTAIARKIGDGAYITLEKAVLGSGQEENIVISNCNKLDGVEPFSRVVTWYKGNLVGSETKTME